jgi:hypothetical protein
MSTMKPNPGGQLDPVDIVGRDPLVRRMWEVLEGRSIYMNDLRRIGKTQILNRMEALTPEGWLVVKRDLGGFPTAAEFAASMFKDSHGLRLSLQKVGWSSNAIWVAFTRPPSLRPQCSRIRTDCLARRSEPSGA